MSTKPWATPPPPEAAYGRIADRNKFWLVLEELSAYGLTCIPGAHCYLYYDGGRLDIAGVPTGAEPIGRFLHEEPIAVDQIGAYKNDLHRRFLRDWIVRTDAVQGLSVEEVWRIREECIAALGAGEYAKP